MDGKPVRVAGYLLKQEYKSSKVLWCVIRNGNFYIYNTPSQGHASQLSEAEEIPVQTFPISHLSATAYVLPKSHKRTPTHYALQLDCAKSGQSSTFYANHEWELERWVDGIKAEASSDNNFPVNDQRSLLPPSVEVTELRHQHRCSADFGHRSHKVSPEAIQKRDVVVQQSDSVFDSIMKDDVPQKSLQRAPLLSEKHLKKTFMTRALPDLVVSSQGFNSLERKRASNFSSPTLSRSSSHRSSYQDSADESSLASSITSSPLLSRNATMSTQTSGRANDTSNVGTIQTEPNSTGRKLSTVGRDQIRIDKKAKPKRTQATIRELGLEHQSSPMFYVNKNVKSVATPHLDQSAKGSGRLTEKRHTITVLQDPASRGVSPHEQQRLTQQRDSLARSHRHSIAPLTSLDFQIHQRKRNSKPQLSTTSLYKLPSAAVDSDSGETEDSENAENGARVEYLAANPSSAGLHDNFETKDRVADSLSDVKEGSVMSLPPSNIRRNKTDEDVKTHTYFPGIDVLEDFDNLNISGHFDTHDIMNTVRYHFNDDKIKPASTEVITPSAQSLGCEGANNLIKSQNMQPSEKFAAYASQSVKLGELQFTSENVNKPKQRETYTAMTTGLLGTRETWVDTKNVKGENYFTHSCNVKTDVVNFEAPADNASSNGSDCNLLFSKTRNKTANTCTMESRDSSNKLFRPCQVADRTTSLVACGENNGLSSWRRTASVSDLNSQDTVFFGNLRRTVSEGNIFKTFSYNTRMRHLKNTIPVLSKLGFIETYGHSRLDNSCKDFTANGMQLKTSTDNTTFQNCSDDHKVEGASSDNRSSSDDSCSSVGVGLAKSLHPSTSSESANSSRSKKSFRAITSAFRKSPNSNEQLRGKPKNNKPTVLHLPAPLFTNASHQGFIDQKIKKRTWERFWCVLQDSCLYCYNSPQSDVTRDAILLRGYDVVADVTNMNRNRFLFRLEQTGSPALKFGTDNHQDFLLWIGALEKDTRIVTTERNANNSHRCESPQLSISGSSHASLKSQDSSDESSGTSAITKSMFDPSFEQELVEIQKHKLLKEILSQQQKILDDQKQFSQKVESDGSPSHTSEHQTYQTVMRRNVVIDKYERARDVEEAKVTKCMTLLNRRRNSVQLKVDQLSREIAPKSGKKRRQNHQQFAAFEAKLHEMKTKLGKIDEEIRQLQATKQNVIEKISERQELELLLTEQQDNLAIMRRHENDEQPAVVNRRRHQLSNTRDTLMSIDELSSISDCCSSTSSDSMQEQGVFRTMSTPRYPRSKRSKESKNLSAVSIASVDFGINRNISQSTDENSTIPKFNSSGSLNAQISSSSLSSSTSSLHASADRQAADVDPAVIANIEMFEKFSNLRLQKLRREKV